MVVRASPLNSTASGFLTTAIASQYPYGQTPATKAWEPSTRQARRERSSISQSIKQLPYRQTNALGASTSISRRPLLSSVHSNDGGLSGLQPVSISTQIVLLFSQVYLQTQFAAPQWRRSSTFFFLQSNTTCLSRLPGSQESKISSQMPYHVLILLQLLTYVPTGRTSHV
jgi:hypothetical protein